MATATVKVMTDTVVVTSVTRAMVAVCCSVWRPVQCVGGLYSAHISITLRRLRQLPVVTGKKRRVKGACQVSFSDLGSPCDLPGQQRVPPI